MTNPLDLTQDLTFKYLFSQCPEELSAFLDSVLHQSTRSLELVSGIRSGSMSYQKAIEMDLCATFREGCLVNVEMQRRRNRSDLLQRWIYYASQLLMSQELKGKEYEQIRPVYVIVLADYCEFSDEAYEHRFTYRTWTGQPLIGGQKELTNIILLELPKMKKEDPSEMNECEMWMYYLKNHHRKPKRRNHPRNHEKK